MFYEKRVEFSSVFQPEVFIVITRLLWIKI